MRSLAMWKAHTFTKMAFVSVIFSICPDYKSIMTAAKVIEASKCVADSTDPNALDIKVQCDEDQVQRFGCCASKFDTRKKCDDDANCTGLSKCLETITPNYKECRILNKKFLNVKINESGSRSLLPARIGKKCNPELYDKRMRGIWEKYITCPYDYDVYDEQLKEILDETHYHDGIMDDLCFSKLIEECSPKTNRCECFKKVFKDPKGLQTILNFTQYLEGTDHCGQPAGGGCTHNMQAIINKEVNCQVTPQPGFPVAETFTCERDAGCGSLLEKDGFCPLNKVCECVCAYGYVCIGSGSDGKITVVGYWTTHLIAYIVIISLWHA